MHAASRAQLIQDVTEEASKYGALQGVAAPLPPPQVTALEPARVYLKYSQASESAAAREIFHSRMFDENCVAARYVQEMAFVHAQAGMWDADILSLGSQPGNPGQALPGPPPPGSSGPMPGAFAGQPLPGPPALPAGAGWGQ